MRHWFYGLSLLEGWLPVTLFALGAASIVFLLWRRRRRWWIFVAAALAASAAVCLLLAWLLVHVFYVWPEDLPIEVVGWAALGVFGVVATIATFSLSGRWRRVLAPLAGLLVIAVCGLQINAYFGLLPTVGDLLGVPSSTLLPLESALEKHGDRISVETAPLYEHWHEPAHLAANGALRFAPIPGTVSGWHGRDALVFLPPAYLLKNRPKLPVLVLVGSQPGWPGVWTVSGGLVAAMSHFAAQHHGLAPVVVIPDPNGTEDGNTMCMDTTFAKTDTYMSVDVPEWIRHNLDVDSNPKHWAIGGFSFGGTCAVQMATRHPQIYPNFMSFSGEREPALAVSRQQTADQAFAGNLAAFTAQVPLTLLGQHRYPNIHGFFAAGADDPEFSANATVLAAAATKAEMHVQSDIVPGAGHSWAVVLGSMQTAMDFMAGPLGLAP
ncbi:alpha/beta hydrolase [Arthrobacter oryzae]|uniref:S-formylglutathione hydrolase FrmB n=1 Tax=Arthrobacter oryzae TaxID=409290 RepID=A0A495FP28_9MICC|nr:alpha/beta hydrolase-fold protein [Arthrobacter oryzae]RKR30507.1 S-formylglutathione hydrolase FrmB [Arthrobacter oryzae]